MTTLLLIDGYKDYIISWTPFIATAIVGWIISVSKRTTSNEQSIKELESDVKEFKELKIGQKITEHDTKIEMLINYHNRIENKLDDIIKMLNDKQDKQR